MSLIIRKKLSYLLVALMVIQSMMVMANEHLGHGHQGVFNQGTPSGIRLHQGPKANQHQRQLAVLKGSFEQTANPSSEVLQQCSDQASQPVAEKHCCDCHTFMSTFLLSYDDPFIAEAPSRTDASEYRFSFLSNPKSPALRPPIPKI